MFTSPVLEKDSIGSQFQYWESFCRFPSPVRGKGSMFFQSLILGKGSIGFTVQYLEKVSGSSNQYWDRFYRFHRPGLGKGSIGSPVQYWEKFL